MIPYTPPKHKITAFNCPRCEAFSAQLWSEVFMSRGHERAQDLDLALCTHCHQYSLWYQTRMIFPSHSPAPLPNLDLPDHINADYKEARSIVSPSPRGAAALLRLAIQKLCKHLGEKGENLNTDIANLVKKSLPQKVQKALDIVRVIGNNAVHPGQIDLKDNADIAQNLFSLVNLIADVMITQPKHVDSLYQSLPANQKKAIQERDTPP